MTPWAPRAHLALGLFEGYAYDLAALGALYFDEIFVAAAILGHKRQHQTFSDVRLVPLGTSSTGFERDHDLDAE